VCQLRPESTGSIALASADPFASPKIFANYLTTETDRRCTTAAMVFARKLVATAPLSDYVAAEMSPGPDYASDADLLRFARGHGVTIFHPVGTCRMGTDDAAVVDPRLHLKGIDGLWVADCSIMPTLPSGNTNVPAIMVGEKASDMILEDVSRG
jgi:choline dehydrogenase